MRRAPVRIIHAFSGGTVPFDPAQIECQDNRFHGTGAAVSTPIHAGFEALGFFTSAMSSYAKQHGEKEAAALFDWLGDVSKAAEAAIDRDPVRAGGAVIAGAVLLAVLGPVEVAAAIDVLAVFLARKMAPT